MSDPAVKISASILSADFADLGAQVHAAEEAGCDEIHFDVMDGRFVPNLTVGAPVLAAVRRHTKLPVSVHMMVEDAGALLDDFAAAGATTYTVHVEACTHLHATLTAIRGAGLRAGVTLNPSTPAAALEAALAWADRVLVMTVNPGFGGQSFIPDALNKLIEARQRIDASGLDIRLEIDGGLKVDNIGEIARAGADTFVAGSAIFNSDSYAATIEAMRKEIATQA